MAITQIDLETKNFSMQVGDIAYASDITSLSTGIASEPVFLGEITEINNSGIKVDLSGTYSGNSADLIGKFLSFSKDITVNKSSLKGYYADVTLTNSSNNYAELFSINSEVVPSSK